MKTFGKILLGVLLVLACVYAVRAVQTQPAHDHPFFTQNRVEVIAHRGGRRLGPENTLATFQKAVDLGVDVLEMDLRSTRDSVLVILHDRTVDRTTSGTGAVQDHTLAQLQALDAGYRWTPDEGQTFPHRGQGIQIPTLQEVFETFADRRMVIEIKQTDPDITQAFCDLIRQYNMQNRVLVACFNSKTLQRFRTHCPSVATSAGLTESITLYALSRIHLSAAYRPDVTSLQIPTKLGPLNAIHPAFLSAAQNHNLKIHVWTINDPKTMQHLIDLNIDGIMTDQPDQLLQLLNR